MNYPQYFLEFALDIVFPVKCIECGEFSSFPLKEYLCKRCRNKIPIKMSSECIGCSASTPLGKTCINCRGSNLIDQLLIVSDYNDPLVVKLIKLLKYRFVKEAITPISLIMKKYLYRLSKNKKLDLIEADPILTFVPLQPRRLNWRGFNQAEFIAQSLADILQLNSEADILLRSKTVKPQAEIKEKEERLKKPLGSFQILNESAVRNRTVILADDICTTGATLNECARVLKEAGAKKVIGFVFARG